MAFHHCHHHQPAAASSSSQCFCCSQQPPLPPPSADPYQIAAIVAHILQTQNQTLNQTPPNVHNFCSQTPKPISANRNQRFPNRESDQFQNHRGFLSLLQRIDALEEALHRYSTSSSSLSIRDVAARTIQTHFRVYLVRRSRALGQLKDLASIKTSVGSLKSCLSRRGFVDWDSLSSRATELLLLLETIKGEDKMIRDSKRSIANEIAEFLDLLDEGCVKRHQVITKTTRNLTLMKNHNRASHSHAKEEVSSRPKSRNANNDGKKVLENVKGRNDERERESKCRNMSDDDKKLIENLKERVESIGRLSRGIENDEKDAEIDDEEYSDDVTAQNSIITRLEKRRTFGKKGKKGVSFAEDGSDDIYDNASNISEFDVENRYADDIPNNYEDDTWY